MVKLTLATVFLHHFCWDTEKLSVFKNLTEICSGDGTGLGQSVITAS